MNELGHVPPSNGRAVVNDSGRKLEIEVPPSRPWGTLLFMSFWLVGWAVGEFIVGAMILSGFVDLIEGDAEYLREPWGGFVGAFMLFWFGGWTVGGISAVRNWMRMAFGREIIRVSAKEIEILEITIGDGRSRTYNAFKVRNLRVARERENDPLAFDYGADTIRFGSSMSEGEADLILERIQEKVQNRG